MKKAEIQYNHGPVSLGSTVKLPKYNHIFLDLLRFFFLSKHLQLYIFLLAVLLLTPIFGMLCFHFHLSQDSFSFPLRFPL